jgi:hypothetical protein
LIMKEMLYKTLKEEEIADGMAAFMKTKNKR